MHDIRAAAVLVYPRAHVERPRRQLRALTIGEAHEDIAAAFERLTFEPVDVLAGEGRGAHWRFASGDESGVDRRSPAAEGCSLRHCPHCNQRVRCVILRH